MERYNEDELRRIHRQYDDMERHMTENFGELYRRIDELEDRINKEDH